MSERRNVTVNGKPLVCGHCGNNRFTSRKAQLNTAAATFFNMDWLNQSADVFVCSGCGQLFWFLNEGGVAMSEGDPDLEESYDVECVQCGRMIPAGQSKCVHCGWTYKA